MKKSFLYLMIVLLSLTFMPAQVNAETATATTSLPLPEPSDAAKAEVLLNRLNEINLMDKSKLNSTEKKELRKEVRSTKKQLRELDGGVYISVGAILIIVLILILLL